MTKFKCEITGRVFEPKNDSVVRHDGDRKYIRTASGYAFEVVEEKPVKKVATRVSKKEEEKSE